MKNSGEGILLLDANGQTRFAAGLGKDASVEKALRQLWLRRGGVPLKRMLVLNDVEHPLTVRTISTPDGVCCLIFDADGCDELVEFIATVEHADDIFRHFITNPYEAVVVADTTGTLRYMSPVHERFFGLQHSDGVGKPVNDVIVTSRLHEVAVGRQRRRSAASQRAAHRRQGGRLVAHAAGTTKRSTRPWARSWRRAPRRPGSRSAAP